VAFFARVARTDMKPRLFNISYLAAIAVAMVGWVAAFGWAAFRVAGWLLA
jgi:hypothetical protein